MRPLVGVAAAVALTVTAQPGPRQVVITGGRVLDVAGGAYREATVILEGDRIAAVQAPGSRLPENAERLDAKGQTIVPGLVDLDVQAAPSAELDVSYFYALSLAHGVTSIRVVDGSLPWAVAQRERVRGGDVLAPRLFVAGPALSSRSPAAAGSPAGVGIERASVIVSDPASVAREVGRQAAAQVDRVRVAADAPAEIVRAAAAAARKGRIRISVSPGLTPVGHLAQLRVDAIDGLQGPLKATGEEAAPRPEASASGLPAAASEPAFDDAWRQLTPADLKAAALALATSRATLIPRLRLDAERVGRDDAKGRQAELALLPDRVRQTREERRPTEAADPAGWPARAGFVKAVVAQGGAVAAGSGAARDGWPVPGLALHRELAALVSAGLTPADAIRAATSVPAGTLGVASTLGQVLPGFRADLLLVRGDP
jgi:imidazolonepropionase-like amidohydrolase